MKILLIVPTIHYKEQYPSFLSFSDFPTGYGYIAAALKQAGHTVIGLNLNNDASFHSAYEMIDTKIRKALQDKPDLIGIGGICIDYKFIKDAISICRQADPTIPIVLGGGIVSNDAEYIFNLLKPDYAIVGEVDEAIVELVNLLSNQVIPTSFIMKTDVPKIDSLPFPDYEPFGVQDMLDNYSMATRVLYRYSRPDARSFVLVASRSCPFSCTFCTHGHERPKYRARSIPNIIEEIRVNYEKYKFNVLIIVDELFAVNKKRMREFCTDVLDGQRTYGWDFDWMFQTHANSKLDRETLELAKQAGCYFFSYGIESASPRVLESMGKKIQVPQIVEAIKLAKETGIGFGGNLIFGDPAETDETISESVDFFIRYQKGAMIFPGFLMPYPGSKLFDQCVERGIITDKLHYYETIDRIRYNMTSMPMNEWMSWMHFIEKIAIYRWGVEECDSRVEPDAEVNPLTLLSGLPVLKIFATCPYCGKEIMYRQIFPKGKTILGVGCTNCNQKIKINIGAADGRVV